MAWVPLIASGVPYTFTASAVGLVELVEIGGETFVQATEAFADGADLFTLEVGAGDDSAPAPDVRFTFTSHSIPANGSIVGSEDYFRAMFRESQLLVELSPKSGLDNSSTLYNKTPPYDPDNPPFGIGAGGYTGQALSGWDPAEVFAYVSKELEEGELGPYYPQNYVEYWSPSSSSGGIAETFLLKVEVDVETPAPAPGRPSLVKDFERVLVSPAVAPQAGVPPTAFRMFAPPLPLGWKYKPYTTDGLTLLPNSSASFWNWPWQIYKPRIFTAPAESVTYQYMTVEAFMAYLSGLGVSSVEFDQATAVYDSEGNVKGFMVWVVTVGEPTQAPPKWWAPLDYMEFVTFPDVATDGPYGYPVGEGMFRGYFDVPTVDGVTRVWGNYWKDHNGVPAYLPAQSDPLPPYCSYRDSVKYNPARVVVLADFPGRAAVPGRPAVYAQDGKVGWNAGATSVDAFAGDCRVTFTPHVGAAVTLGLTRSPRPSVVNPTDLDFAFRFDQPDGAGFRVCILERGHRIGPYFPASADSVFVIERVGGVVTYKVDGLVRHTAEALNFQTLCVGACLYYGGDGVY